ncbi:hypothetical protein C4D60_Mb08t21970 [Musa balbisiana]|uniref:Uncharacterized protein n=1 Tax=Musa balbisiana TaxID=52838 RepID=A0A4S8K5J3_MUSBA|nr:hypothetical protein C4D60_Mb08t21970 [Musa balbisiana]
METSRIFKEEEEEEEEEVEVELEWEGEEEANRDEAKSRWRRREGINYSLIHAFKHGLQQSLYLFWSWVESEMCISDRLSASILMDQTNNQYLSKETSNSWTNN